MRCDKYEKRGMTYESHTCILVLLKLTEIVPLISYTVKILYGTYLCYSGYPPTPNTPGANPGPPVSGASEYTAPPAALSAAAFVAAAATATATATATASMVLQEQQNQQQQMNMNMQMSMNNPQYGPQMPVSSLFYHTEYVYSRAKVTDHVHIYQY